MATEEKPVASEEEPAECVLCGEALALADVESGSELCLGCQVEFIGKE